MDVAPIDVVLGADTELTPDRRLADLGLDSLATVGLLVDVEESFGVEFPDEALTADTFATAASLWSVVAGLPRDEPGHPSTRPEGEVP